MFTCINCINYFLFVVPYPTVTILVNNGEHTGLIVGVTVVYIPIISLALAMVIVVLGIVLYIKRANINQKRYMTITIILKFVVDYTENQIMTL